MTITSKDTAFTGLFLPKSETKINAKHAKNIVDTSKISALNVVDFRSTGITATPKLVACC